MMKKGRMKLLLDPVKFRDFPGGRTGVIVTLAPPIFDSEEEEAVHVVLGHCVSCSIEVDGESDLMELGLGRPDWEASLKLASKLYPASAMVTGICWRLKSGEVGELESVVRRYDVLMRTTNLKSAFHNTAPFLVAVSGVGDNISVMAYELNRSTAGPDGLLQSMEILTSPGSCSLSRYLGQHAALLRLRASLPLYIPIHADENQPFLSATTKIRSSSTRFLIPSVHHLISESSGDLKVKNILPEAFKAASKQSYDNYLQDAPPVVVELLEGATFEGGKSGQLPLAPTLSVGKPLREGCVCITVPIDTLSLVHWDSYLCDLSISLKEGICQQLQTIRDEILWKPGVLHSVSVHHFALHQQQCPVTIVYPDVPLTLQADNKEKSLTNKELKPLRAKWVSFLNLAPRSPLLRIMSRARGDSDRPISDVIKVPGPQIVNPHLAVKHTRVNGGCMALVQGNYLYYHYLHQDLDDSGWGCAYRSLQTLWSWFLLQGYSELEVPTHRIIQAALVDVGDKEKPFLGSREWIGSCEVSIVLNQLLGVDCKIHFCPGGEFMGSVGRVLLGHFQTEGTPVMIGGGVRAHTILGVDFSETSGETEFLVLDPHYTGKDDLKIISEKGCCAWKPSSFWETSAYYNLCMPQVSEDM